MTIFANQNFTEKLVEQTPEAPHGHIELCGDTKCIEKFPEKSDFRSSLN